MAMSEQQTYIEWRDKNAMGVVNDAISGGWDWKKTLTEAARWSVSDHQAVRDYIEMLKSQEQEAKQKEYAGLISKGTYKQEFTVPSEQDVAKEDKYKTAPESIDIERFNKTVGPIITPGSGALSKEENLAFENALSTGTGSPYERQRRQFTSDEIPIGAVARGINAADVAGIVAPTFKAEELEYKEETAEEKLARDREKQASQQSFVAGETQKKIDATSAEKEKDRELRAWLALLDDANKKMGLKISASRAGSEERNSLIKERVRIQGLKAALEKNSGDIMADPEMYDELRNELNSLSELVTGTMLEREPDMKSVAGRIAKENKKPITSGTVAGMNFRIKSKSGK
jgi:hypothetical protein